MLLVRYALKYALVKLLYIFSFRINIFSLIHLQFSLGLDGKKIESESNVLLASIENMQYAVTLDVLQMVCLNFYLYYMLNFCISLLFICLVQVFSAFGPVLKIAMFDKNGGVQALIQYPGESIISFKKTHQVYIL